MGIGAINACCHEPADERPISVGFQRRSVVIPYTSSRVRRSVLMDVSIYTKQDGARTVAWRLPHGWGLMFVTIHSYVCRGPIST